MENKYMTVLHVEDGTTKIRAKVISETSTEVSVEYRYQGVTWGLTMPKPAKESQPDGFLEWLDGQIKVYLKKTHPNMVYKLQSVLEKYLSLHPQPKPQPSGDRKETISKLEQIFKDKAEFLDDWIDHAVLAYDFFHGLVSSPPSVKPEREERHGEFKSWVSEWGELLYKSGAGRNIREEFESACNWLKDFIEEHAHEEALRSTPPAVQQEDGEVPEEIRQSIRQAASIEAQKWCATGIEDWLEGFEAGGAYTYHKMQEEINGAKVLARNAEAEEDRLGELVNDLMHKADSLQFQLSAKQQEVEDGNDSYALLEQQLEERATEAAEYRNALIKIEILGTAVESPGVFESGRGWEATKNKYAEIAWAARVKYIQQTPTK